MEREPRPRANLGGTGDEPSWAEQRTELRALARENSQEEFDARAFNAAYGAAFGKSNGDSALHNRTWRNDYAYAQFMYWQLGYDHDLIDYYLGYGEQD